MKSFNLFALIFIFTIFSKHSMAQIATFPISHEEKIRVNIGYGAHPPTGSIMFESPDIPKMGILHISDNLSDNDGKKLREQIKNYIFSMKEKKQSFLIDQTRESINSNIKSLEEFKSHVFTKAGGLTQDEINKMKQRIAYLEEKLNNADRLCNSISNTFNRESRPKDWDQLQQIFEETKSKQVNR